MSRTHRLTLLFSTLATALGVSAIAIAATGGANTYRQPAAPTATAAPAVTRAHPARHLTRFRGTITHRNQSHHWFQMRTTNNKRVRIYTDNGTHWDGCDWGDMSNGHHVDVHAYRSHGHWMAAHMQNWSQSGNGGWGNGHWGPHGWMWGNGPNGHHGSHMGGSDPGGMMW